MSNIDPSVPVFGVPTTESVRDNFTVAKSEIEDLQSQIDAITATAVGAVQKSGDTMTGLLVLSGAPLTSLGAATKAYVDTMLPLAGGTMTGLLTLSGPPTAALHAATKAYVDGAISGSATFLPITGGTITGSLALSPGGLQATAKVATFFAGLNAVLNQQGNISWNAFQDTGNLWKSIAGGGVCYINANAGQWSFWTTASSVAGNTVTPLQVMLLGPGGISMQGSTDVTLARAPTLNNHAATKAYVDTMLPLAGGTLTGTLAQTTGNITTNGAVVPGNAACGGNLYISGDSTSRQVNFHTNYAVQLVMASGTVRFIQNGAVTLQVDISGNTYCTTSCYPSFTSANDFRLVSDATYNHLIFANNWDLYYTRANGTLAYQRSGTNWFLWRAGDAVIFNNVANMGGIGPYADYSDIRGKRDVEDSDLGLDAIKLLRPKSFIRLPRTDYLPPPPRREIGFVAQELRDVIPEAVIPFEDVDADEPGLAIMTTPIVAALVNAVRELEARLARLERN